MNDEIRRSLSSVQDIFTLLEEKLSTDEQRELLNQAALVIERLNPVKKLPALHEKGLYYWPNGHWCDDKDEARLMDQVNAFGVDHQVLIVSKGADISAIVAAAIEGGNHGS